MPRAPRSRCTARARRRNAPSWCCSSPPTSSSFISGAEIAIDGGYIAAGLAGLRNRIRAEFTQDKN